MKLKQIISSALADSTTIDCKDICTYSQSHPAECPDQCAAYNSAVLDESLKVNCDLVCDSNESICLSACTNPQDYSQTNNQKVDVNSEPSGFGKLLRIEQEQQSTHITIGDTFSIYIPKPKKFPERFNDIGSLLSTLISAAIVFAAILSLLYLIWGGLEWITSGGKPEELEGARGRIVNAIVGLVIVASSWAIFQLIQNILVGEILSLGT